MQDESFTIVDLVTLLVLGALPALAVGLTLQITWLRRQRIVGSAHKMGIFLLLLGTVSLTLGICLVLWVLTPGWLSSHLPSSDSFAMDALIGLLLPSVVAVPIAVVIPRALLTRRRGGASP